MGFLFTEVHRAGRRLRRAPVFAFAVVATLALGIGATSAIFTLVNSVLLQPLPYADSDRLVALGHTAPGFGLAEGGVSEGLYQHYREHNRVFDEMGVYLENVVSVTDDDDPERVHVALVTPSLFSILGVSPFHGRILTSEDAAPDAPGVVVIGHELWVRRYGADPGIIGRTIELNRTPREVVGILPPGINFPAPETQIWYGMSVSASEAGVQDLYLSGIARLRRGVSPEDAALEMRRLVASLPEAYPDVTPGMLRTGQLHPVVEPLRDVIVGEIRTPLVILLCTALFVLLIACANVTNLFLVRAERQRHEVTVERALGAGVDDLARRFFSESLLLAMLGGVVGLALAYAGVRSRFGFEPGQIPRLHEVRVDTTVVAFTLGLTLLVGGVLGLMSLLRVGRSEIASVLKGGSGRSTVGRERQSAQRFLVAVQIALALTLLIGSAVMFQSIWRLRSLDMGFDPTGILTAEISLPTRPYPAYPDAAGFHNRVLEQLRAVPGVVAAEAISTLPLTQVDVSSEEPLAAEERLPGVNETAPRATMNLATPGYFSAMRIPLRRGRSFQPGDLATASYPVVLNEVLARALFHGEDPVGKRIRLVDRPDYPAYTVIGVVGGTPGEKPTDGPVSVAYFPILADPAASPQLPRIPRNVILVVRTSLPPTSLIPTVRRVVHGLDSKLPLAHVRTMDQIVAASTARTRLTTVLLMAAAGVAFFLGIIGIYGIVAYTVSQRTSEFGVRLALGASPREVSQMVLRQGALLALVGIVLGVMAALALMRFLSSLLYGVSPSDPVAFAAMSVFLFSVALVASYVPARRAGKIDPIRALKAE